MALFVRQIRKFSRLHLLSSLCNHHLIIYHPSRARANSASFFTQTFHQTPSSHTHSYTTTRFHSTLLPPSPPFPFDLNDLKSENTHTEEVAKLVQNVHTAKDLPTEEEASTFLDELGLHPNLNLLALAVWELRDSCEIALLVFRWGGKWEVNDERLLSLIVWVLGAGGKFNIAWSLIREAHRSSSLVNIRGPMLVMMERYAAMNFPDKAIKTFEAMENLRLSPDHDALYTLLQSLCANGNPTEAEDFLLQNKKLYPLETKGFNILLNAWCHFTVDITEAKRVWREMSRNCITPDQVSYTLMITCFSKVNNLFDSLRLYDEMKKRGWEPSLQVYNSLIRVLGSEGCFDEARRVMGRVREMGMRPDVETYNSLIVSLCGTKRFTEARAVLNEMMEGNVRPDRETYHAFLRGAEDFESTVGVLDEMRRGGVGVGPDGETFSLVFDGLCDDELGRPEDALKIWVEMKDGYGVEPGSEHYGKVIRSLMSCGYLAKANELCDEMVAKGLRVEPKVKRVLEEQTKGKKRERGKGRSRRKIVQRPRRSVGVSLGGNGVRRRRKRGGKGKQKSRKGVIGTEIW